VSARLRILTYHRVGIPRGGRRWEPLTVPPRRFARQLRLLHALGFRLQGLDAVADWLRGGSSIPPHPAVLTFDDGFADLYEHAFPLLAQHRAQAVVYLVTDRRDDAWRRTESPERLPLLDARQVREMAAAGITFGSHSRTHPRLTTCTDSELRDEVTNSRKRLEDLLGAEVRHFCYPHGDFDDRVVDAVAEAGYATACTTRRGTVRPGADPLRLPRLTIGKRMGLLRFLARVTFRS